MTHGAAFRDIWSEQIEIARSKAAAPPPVPTVRLLAAWAGGLIFAALLLWMMGGHHIGFAQINGLTPVLPEGVWSFLTSLGDTAVALALFLPLSWRNGHLCRVVLISAILGLIWTHAFKQLMPLPRPGGLLDPGTFHTVGKISVSGTFPSGHSQTAMTLAAVAVLTLQTTPWRWVVLLLGTASALSRVSVGMHWPVDTLAGAAGGIVTTLMALAIANRLGPPSRWGIALVLGICAIAAMLVATGHPRDHPAAQPWLALVGMGSLAAVAWPVLRRRFGGVA